jgi:cytochrome c oxidase subunit 2
MDSIYDSTQTLSNEFRTDNSGFCSTNNAFGVDRNLVIPINTNILLSVTSTDVIHSWAVPQLGIKVDAVPGKLTHTILFTYTDGLFYGQCSELCGVYHGFMPICVEAVEVELFYC